MTELLERAVSELKKRSHREQDEIARDILARIGTPIAATTASAFGRGRSVMTLTNPDDTLTDILSDEDIAKWYPDQDLANP